MEDDGLDITFGGDEATAFCSKVESCAYEDDSEGDCLYSDMSDDVYEEDEDFSGIGSESSADLDLDSGDLVREGLALRRRLYQCCTISTENLPVGLDSDDEDDAAADIVGGRGSKKLRSPTRIGFEERVQVLNYSQEEPVVCLCCPRFSGSLKLAATSRVMDVPMGAERGNRPWCTIEKVAFEAPCHLTGTITASHDSALYKIRLCIRNSWDLEVPLEHAHNSSTCSRFHFLHFSINLADYLQRSSRTIFDTMQLSLTAIAIRSERVFADHPLRAELTVKHVCDGIVTAPLRKEKTSAVNHTLNAMVSNCPFALSDFIFQL
jgi:hypothetical protein